MNAHDRADYEDGLTPERVIDALDLTETHALFDQLRALDRTQGDMSLKVYVATHPGHYMTGCSVIVARSLSQARALLGTALIDHGIRPQDWEDIEIRILDVSKPAVDMLFNGDY
jgi:hypothetical protein